MQLDRRNYSAPEVPHKRCHCPVNQCENTVENKLLNYTVITNLPVPEKQMQPHLHMCPSVCFYTLCLQPVGEIVLIQAAV